MTFKIKRFAGFLFLLFTCSVFLPSLASAQNFNNGMELYEEARYQEAAQVFSKIETPEAKLFTGKSYFGMGQYVKAKTFLSQVPQSAPNEIYLEALYTTALSNFQLEQFADALEQLYRFKEERVQTQLITDGLQLYNDILNYLTLNQRKEVYQSVSSQQIKYDLIKSSLGKVSYSTAKLLINEYKTTISSDTLSQSIEELESAIQDSSDYAMQVSFGRQIKAPEGITYNIGAALPQYEAGENEFEISQGLYFGYVFAAEEFNQQNSDKKAFIRYKNTGASTDSSEYLMTNLAWNYNADAVLGPLFSEPAEKMAKLAELYQLPMLAPLANSDSLNIDNPYVFQANPTFASHGRKMAQFAVNRLNMDTLAVLAEKNSLGETSAYAFRDEVEKLGAKVIYFFVEDLESRGYEIAEFTDFFNTDTLAVNSSIDRVNHNIDAIYAPFTGQAAPTLIDLLLIDLQAMDSETTVLGSQEWGATNIPGDRLNNRDIYFSESYYINTESNRVKQFKTNYKNRFGVEANRFSMIGYDAATYLLQTLEKVENPALLKFELSKQPFYEGLISNIRFDGKHVNQEVKVFRLSAEEGVQPAQ